MPAPKGDPRRTSLLALIPLTTALLLGALVIPRPIRPAEVPLPIVDGRALAAQEKADDAAAVAAREHPLDANVRALGALIRTFNALEVGGDPQAPLAQTRTELDRAVGPALEVGGVEGLLRLRAVQMQEFLEEVRRFEETGHRTTQLDEVAGTFVQGMTRAGWCLDPAGRRATWPPQGPVTIVADESVRRTAFKLVWAKLIGLEGRRELQPSLDEMRALYAFYFQHAHAPEAQHVSLDYARAHASDAAACEGIDATERQAALGWLMQKLKEYAALDPRYPFDYARGIVLYHRRDYAASAEAFRAWLAAHPDGPWALRARNFLAAAIEATNAF